MESDYDRKFEDMKKYIPFLESMITRLETSNLPTNPRQAQLDKIRSLRDLLQNKKKRMKMENLLKCEQVLVNLYAKVEQRDGKQESKSHENKSSVKNTDLNVVRSKLKSVASKLSENTLPEIARACEMEQVSVQGNKEPALFQRRPNPVSPVSVPTLDDKKTSPQSCKKNYTRVLLSPEKNSRNWSENGESKTEKPLFSRRSPKKIYHKDSPAYKRERKKSRKSKHSQSKDLNITLNVPEESLSSLDTDDILSRIINCSDGDVDIATLRELRSQILGELKQTGVKDDISDLLLKSCKKYIKEKKHEEVEEGELSDSESEAIENIYGSLVIVDKDESESTVKDKARKIQICLVINSDKNQLDKKELHDEENKTSTTIDSTDFESYPIQKKPVGTDKVKYDTLKEDGKLEENETSQLKTNEADDGNACTEKEEIKEEVEVKNMNDMPLTSDKTDLAQDNDKDIKINETVKSFTPNFYNTANEDRTNSNTDLNLKNSVPEGSMVQIENRELRKDEISTEPLKPLESSSVEIPLLNLEATAKQDIVSEIDILQALKKEILGETMSPPSSELITPPLHQPKITKVASAQEIVKKRISIENYKQKCNSSPKPLFFREFSKKSLKEDKNKKQSLKLTEKECERFNFPIKLPLNESSDDEDNSSVSFEDIYSDLAPKSPDHEDFADTGIKPPVIIPSDPVKPTVVSSPVDIDMRNVSSVTSQISKETTPLTNKITSSDTENIQMKLTDPRKSRTRWEQSQPNLDNVLPTYMPSDTMANQLSHGTSMSQPNPLTNPNMTPSRSIVTAPNMTPSMSITPNMTPLFVPNMTPNARTYEMTPSRSNFDSEDMPNRNHVYAPVFMIGNTFESNETSRESRQRDDPWNFEVNQASRDMDFVRHNDARQERFDSRDTYRLDCPQTPIHSFGRLDCPSTPLPSFGRMEGPTTPLPSFGRMEGPTTPIPSFGRTERPIIKPINSFGRLDGSTIPAHSYGRSDASITSAHSFSRADGSSTPVQSFGRADGSATPVQSFGRTDGSATPSYSFGISDQFAKADNVQKYSSTKTSYGRKDPRLNRNSDYDNYNRREDDREFGYYKDRKFNAEYNSDQKYTDSYRRYDQFNRNRSRERNAERYYKDYVSSRDLTGGRSLSKDRASVSHRHNRDSKGYNDTRYNLKREKSVDRKYSARASSVSRPLKNDTHISVSYSEDSPITIDTSVNSTFQRVEGKISLKSFDARRQRAASVGRALTRECSIGRSTFKTMPESRKQVFTEKRKDFLRASSVGRDTHIQRCENLKDIKADLLSFKLKNDLNIKKMYGEMNSAKNKNVEKINDTNKNEKGIFLVQHNLKRNNAFERYSPKKNYRDPRMRRESRFDNTDKNKGKTRFSRESKKSGIVYSDANISKGILGYGVKNYKIPKIKRPIEICVNGEVTKEVSPAMDESAKEKKSEDNDGYIKLNKNETHIKAANIDSHKSKEEICITDARMDKNSNPSVFKEDNGNTEKSIQFMESSERRVTRSATTRSIDVDFSKCDEYLLKSINRTRKCKKKTLIYDDSESDVEDSIIKTDKDVIPPSKKEIYEDRDNIEMPSIIINQNDRIYPATNEHQNKNTDENIINTLRDETSQAFRPERTGHLQITPADVEINMQSNDEILSSDRTNKSSIFSNEKLNNESTGQENSVIDTGNNISSEKKSNDELNSSFGELEIFSDNIASDPVLDNINALIADLDHDLDAAKNNETRDQFTQEILLENMLENITVNNVDTETKCLKSFESLTDENTLSSDCQKQFKTAEVSVKNNVSSCKSDKDRPCDLDQDKNETSKNISSVIECKESEANARVTNIDNDSNEAIVSTTKEDLHFIENNQGFDDQSKEQLTNVNDISMPYSTINVVKQSKSSEETIPDSTHEPNECNDITSTNLSSELENKSVAIVQTSQSADQGDSIGKFLSILQDKSKIKELLSLLGEQASDNAKIKKKLEKLSEIVSDDDDDDCSENVNNDNSKKKVEKDKLIIHKLDEVKKRDETSVLITKNVEKLQQDNKEIEVEIDTYQDKTEGAKSADDKKDVTRVSNENKNISEESQDFNQNTEEPETECEIQKELKVSKKGRSKKLNKGRSSNKGRITRSGAVAKPKVNKPSRELLNLQADIREMFLKDDEEILGGTTGLRMCRLAKLVDEKSQSPQDDTSKSDVAPVVRLEKIKNIEESTGIEKKSKNTRKSKGTLEKQNKFNEESDSRCSMMSVTNENEITSDPYTFDTDSFSESICTSEKRDDSSEYESDSAESSKSEATERTPEVKKKPKRKRSAWQSGVIVPKCRKKKNQTPKPKSLVADSFDRQIAEVKIPDLNCYIDKSYCFSKNVLSYSCRFCDYKASDIVHHYKKQHPHSEVPLSRLSPDVAQEAIKQCELVDFQSISTIPNSRSVCRFCFKEFVNCKSLESFFWHIVSVHTGEYTQICTTCDNNTTCPFTLDVPPPPIKQKGHLTGHICGSCNYTQISLENLKTHVITRHNDEQTEVYTISLSHMSTKSMNSLLKRAMGYKIAKESEEQRVLRSSRSSASIARDKSDFVEESDVGDDASTSSSLQELKLGGKQERNNLQSKITFENDSDAEKTHHSSTENVSQGFKVKVEPKYIEEVKETSTELENRFNVNIPTVELKTPATESTENNSNKDIYELPHFKITYTESGSKEYLCCIKNSKYHYKTSLLISFKKHVQMKHSEKWDGYCYLCKVIVTPQGLHNFKNCLQHFIDKHLDNFPVLEKQPKQTVQNDDENKGVTPVESQSSLKPFLSVRPLSELISNTTDSYPTDNASPLPIIESVMSLGSSTEPNVSYPSTETVQVEPRHYDYEKAQAEIMSKKNRIILDAMMSHEKLVQVFKCAGRFCSYTTDSAEDALQHVSTHSRVGGDSALKCAYCDFDSCGNAIDLVTHVFKSHGFCQYTCGYCFYRAAASQLVNAHIGRVHEAMSVKTVLKTSFTTEPMNEENMLSRESAVPFYVCNCEDNETSNKCKFKTYTPGKLCEHIQTKHSDVTVYKCFICQVSTNCIAELIHHYKSHGLKLYQCAWCVFGADNENELLTHASVHHPAYQPKAYLRVITNKEGTTEYRVLPLAHLNKSNIPITDVSPTGARENPVREAERSVDLEKLIGHTTMFIESMAVPDTEPPNEILQDEPIISESMLNFVPAAEARPSTPKAPVILAQQSTPIIKHETINQVAPPETANFSDDIVCLDSDEEDPVIPTPSIETSQETPLQLPLKALYKCSKCAVISKSSNAFKTHLVSCFYNSNAIPCAYCSFKAPKTRLLVHYSKTHQLKKTSNIRYDCLDCNLTFVTIEHVKSHQKSVHNAAEINISPKVSDGTGIMEFSSKKRASMRRKTSASSSGEPPAKIRKFGPQDVDQLPINPIFDSFIYCSLCEFSTKVRLNMVRHLQLHANLQPVPQTAPVNPVPHLETNEMHFDKMVNLASSSLVSRQEKNNRSDPTVAVLIPPERVSRYPKYVHERTRHTCGARGCSYISLDENMFKYHWETLHSGSTEFHCVHCPSYQTLDTSVSLTASRIIAHLKMHDVRLYACSQCAYYHYKRQVVERHINEVHAGGNVMIVREETSNTQQPISQVTPTTAPTMDLKPWQCGLCEFKSLLRPEVAEHCAKIHNSKMQYKCVYCVFRTSNIDNITKHQSKSHQDKPAVTFYYYYREGSLADGADGTPFWEMQRIKYRITETTVKREDSETPSSSTLESPSNPPAVNLSIVKEELKDLPEDSIDDLCKQFGQFCEPNGLSYKCPLCKNVIENTKDAMQSHLFEELQYRKWGCGICFYKAFHKRGLSDHMQSEHHQNRDPLELPVDVRVETWVTKLLEYQETIIDTNKANLAQQKVEILKKPLQLTEIKSASSANPTKTSKPHEKPTKEDLENTFGSLGMSKNMSFCCPKCNEVIKEENVMRDHLESELNKIRWCCSSCSETFQSYHQAQFHCKSHSGQSSRPLEAPRNSTLRTAWVDAVLEVQKLSMNIVPLQSDTEDRQSNVSVEPLENSLLVVRYEERVPTPEVQSIPNRSVADEENERMSIAEPVNKKMNRKKNMSCNHCIFTTTRKKIFNDHTYRHYGLKPFTCAYCKLTGALNALQKHQKIYHPMKPINIINTEIPSEPPHEWLKKSKRPVIPTTMICLTCQSPLMEMDVSDHVHENVEPEFGRVGEVIVRCSTCSTLHKDINKFLAHNKTHHPNDGNYVFYKLSQENRLSSSANCSYCPQKFSLREDLKAHIEAFHAEELKYATIEPRQSKDVIVVDDEEDAMAEVTLSPSKKVARKSTTKLPYIRTIAKKSTTKLPFSHDYEREYSFYGAKPSTEGLENVTTLMPFYNTFMPVTFERLKGILNLEPRVVVRKLPNFQKT